MYLPHKSVTSRSYWPPVLYLKKEPLSFYLFPSFFPLIWFSFLVFGTNAISTSGGDLALKYPSNGVEYHRK